MCEPQLPLPVQLYLWRLLKPFLRAKLGRVHEASCYFCQRAPGHHQEMKEACSAMERIFVQNIYNDVPASLRAIFGTVPRWRLIQASLPFVLHAAAGILNNKKDFQNLSPLETTLLYILHWTMLDAADECADQNGEGNNPFYYLFSISTMTLFVYLFVPLVSHLKDVDFKGSLRLENGQKIWYPIYECRHPEAPCFTAHCRPKPRALWKSFTKSTKNQTVNDDVFVGTTENPPSQNARLSDQAIPACTRGLDEDASWVSSPKDKAFPETIPEESSSTEDEHVVIFTLPSLDESERMLGGVKQVSTIYAGEASIFHVAMGRRSSCTKPTLTIEQVTSISDLDSYRQYEGKSMDRKMSDTLREKDDKSGKYEKDKGTDSSKTKGDEQRYPSSGDSQTRSSAIDMDVRAATFLDVAIIRCLFISQWQEEGVFWALQFLYNRLRRINEESSTQQMPRRRSNSLPIPKIEVSIYQSPESKKREGYRDIADYQDTRDTVLSADISFYGDVTYKAHDTEISHTRRASEKTKKRMKMADLKAFVETKLLSKSEKALEKIGQEEPKRLFEQECHRSLDAGEQRLTRQPSVCSKIFDAKDPDFIEHPSNLIKGKSMPSLRYIGDTKVDKKDSHFYNQSCVAPNPIITVTEHTPIPSPEYMKRQGSVDSQLDVISSQVRKTTYDRKPSLTRSQTDSNITYTGDDSPEAPGSGAFITEDGDIELEVVLKAIHNISLRDNHSCSLRVCESILNLLELLMDMGVLKHCIREESMEENQDSPEKSEGDKRQGSADSAPRKSNRLTAHNLMMNCIINILRHLGCPHGCLDGIRGPQADFCRSQIQTIFGKLYKASSKQFATFLRDVVKDRRINSVVEFFHSYIGFCIDPGSLLSPLNQKRGSSKSPDTMPQGGYATNFGAGLMGGTSNPISGCNNTPNSSGSGGNTAGYPHQAISGVNHRFRSIESQIIGCVFKTMVTRCVRMLSKLKSQESISLYCDIRQFISYVKEAHGGAFRRVVLSAILDSADKPGKKPNSVIQTTRVIRHLFPWETDQNGEIDAEGCYTIDEKGARKFLFKKKSTSSTCASLLETELSDENVKISQSPLGNIRKKHHTLTPRQSERNLDLNEPSYGIKKSRKTARLRIGGIVNWFRKEYRRSEADSHENSESPTEYSFARQPSLRRAHRRAMPRAPRGVGRTLQKAKRRMENKLSRIGLVKSKEKENREEVRGSYFSRRDSVEQGDPSRESEFVVLKERRLVPKKAIFEGIQRLSFLLETCQPGSVPDHHLMGALLDLPYAPVVARAAMLLECAHLVHQCNKGHWPNWMKLNFPMFRPSMALNNRSAPTGIRRTHVLQRAAGKLFYQWAETIGMRLEEFLAQDRQNYDRICSVMRDENKHKVLAIEDVEEDFFDEASINTYGSTCPIALRLIACNLLFEITAFLRETYPNLPKSSRLSTKERAPPWEKLYSREANRRWSMALSSMGHSQASAQSLQSIAGDRETERKISFVLHEPDNESEGSSKSNVTIQGEDMIMSEKEKSKRMQTAPGRPFLLRRGTTTNTATGSFKRRSLKLRRNTKEGKDIEVEAFRRADSIQSKRKVSSLSDRSDTSEPGLYGEVSGEESPGILSDDQPPESPSDSNDTDEFNKNFPWMKVVVQTASNYNFMCCHQNYCHPYCHRRQMRACDRLVRAVRKTYGEEFEIESDGGWFNTEIEKKDDPKKEKRNRKVSDQTSLQVSPVRRKDSVGRKYKIDKSFDGSQSGQLHGESSKDMHEQEFDYSQDFWKFMKSPEDEKEKEPHPMIKYMKDQVRDSFQAPFATLLKGAVVMSEELFVDVLPIAWVLLLEFNQEVAASAASLFIVASVRAPTQAINIMQEGLQNEEASIRINSILRFQVLWKFRYQVWPRMEEAAHMTFKVPPPGIEFTLPSPKIGIESLPVVDPPWMPQVKTKVEEVTINQERHRALVTATKTRKKQQTELIKQALQAQDDKKREERANFLITTIPITFQAAYEPSPVGDDHDEANVDEDGADLAPRNLTHHGQSALSLFPSTLCSAIVQIITLLDDPAVGEDGTAVYDMAYQVIWNCLVEDSALFLRYILERLTREKQDVMFKHLRHLIRFVPKLPQQAAFALYNYIIGYIMFYVRTPHEDGQNFIGSALSILWMVVHSVHGIMFKDLKQILRKEQCDASILLTANVPSAKKIIVHGPQDPDAGGIPSQFPVQEDTQFCQILRESLDFFGIEESKHKEYFLVDHKTHQIHNPSSYVRDYYFFKRSQYPQLELVHMEPEDAFNALQRQELVHKFVETGKVLLTWAILKNVDMVVQRVVFLHEELMKLPSFPRKALEADLDLYKGGELGKELLALDVMHKFMWVRLIARMFEAMAGNFAYSGDIHLFLNVLNGTLILHSEDSCILRYVVATYINAAHNFKNIFSTNGYFLIMPTLLQLYSTHQTNKLVTTTVEYAVKQFYLMNRKPFILQMFGSVSAILDTDESSIIGEAHKVPSSCLFNLLLSLETPSPDPLNIGELVKEEKPLKAIDFCYHDENEMVTILDCISLCVMVISYAADSVRGQQMLVILEAIMPCYVQQIQLPTYNKEGKTEKEIINQLAIAMRTLVNNSEALAKYYNRPQKSSPEHKGSSQRNYGKGPYSPGFDFDEEAQIGNKTKTTCDIDDNESHKNEFVRPRDTLLNMVGEFVSRASVRLVELNKKSQDGKNVELLDSKCHVRLADIAHSLLKISPYDPEAMACRGLKRYMTVILPSTEWANDDMRPALILILRRLDKTFSKIYKKASIRRNINWEAASDLLKGVYETLLKCPYVAHFQNMKALLSTCQSLITGDTTGVELTSAASIALMSKIPPQHFCSTVLKLIALQVISLGEGYSLENICGHAMFATASRAENVLLNLLMPLFLRVGTGRKDVPKLRQSDICFALSSVLNVLWPTGTKTMQTTAPNLKPSTDLRAGSLTFAARDAAKNLTKTSTSLYQVAFLALKIIIICYENELRTEWPRILRTMKLLNKRNEASPYLWNFIEFVVTHRTPLYIQMMPFVIQKIGQAPISEHERSMQGVIRDKINGIGLGVPKCRGALLMDLFAELNKLKEELNERKLDEAPAEPKRNVAEQQQQQQPHGAETAGATRTQRPSLLIDLLTGDLASRGRTPAETPCSASSSLAAQHSHSSASSATKTSQQSQLSAAAQPQISLSARGSVSSTSAGSGTLRDAADLAACPGTSKSDQPQATDRSQLSSTTNDEHNNAKPHPILTRQKTSKLRFFSSVELRHSSGETVTSQLSPSSPNEDSSGESRPDKPRLQRSMGQSKRTFRLRKSRRAHVEQVTTAEVEQTDSRLSPAEQPKEPGKEQLVPPPAAATSTTMTTTISTSEAVATVSQLSDSSSIRSRRSSSLKQGEHADKTNNGNGEHSLSCQLQTPQLLSHHHHLQLRPQSDISWDEDTSSTSGYRESYSMQLVSLESNGNRLDMAPPLASPDLPSTSSTTTNYMMGFDGSSPECSINSNGAEKTALLTQSSPRTSSQHSLLMLGQPPQDEDTLI
ncbi:protein unc-80 homolog isoform X2 [Phymastichus coffea]|uniref:protein unc-80 homolog isoform X2 n=1 Tax=Phymastichus coffea TaxID=108790 RepID=UPI00273C2189|nr:protein unc-80 homolog isoform X2 [Phymastichus coffea]